MTKGYIAVTLSGNRQNHIPVTLSCNRQNHVKVIMNQNIYEPSCVITATERKGQSMTRDDHRSGQILVVQFRRASVYHYCRDVVHLHCLTQQIQGIQKKHHAKKINLPASTKAMTYL